MRFSLALWSTALLMLTAPRQVRAAAEPPVIVRVTTASVCRIARDDTAEPTRPPIRTDACTNTRVEHIDPQGTALWLLANVTIPPTLDTARTPMALLMQAMASTTIYWDGQPISASGHASRSRDSEIPGQFVHIAPLRSAELHPGVHQLAVLMSSHRGPLHVAMPVHVLALAPLDLIREGVGSGSSPILLALGALLLAAVYFATISITTPARGAGRRDAALLAIMIACALVQGVAEIWRTLLPVSYVGQMWRLVIILLAATGVGAALVAYTTRRFAPTWQRRAGVSFLVVAGIAWVLPGFDLRTLTVLAAAAALATAAAAVAAWRGVPGSRAVTAVLVAFVVAGFSETGVFLDRELFVGLTLLTLVLLVDHVQQMRRVHAEVIAARQQVQQLELEVLRQRLTPHWLLNMLNAVTAWIEEEPTTAVRMVGLLGEEFNRLVQPEQASLIAVRDELAACERLLSLMSLRSGRTFALDAAGVTPTLSVPPGVLHTLVENALTHGQYRRGAVFTVRQNIEHGVAVLAFEAPRGEPVGSALDTPPREHSTEGFGLHYIRARLRAAFGDDAALEYGPRDDGGWRTVLRLGAMPA